MVGVFSPPQIYILRRHMRLRKKNKKLGVRGCWGQEGKFSVSCLWI